MSHTIDRATGLRSALIRLDAWIQEETEAKKRLLGVLDRQHDAIAANDTAGIIDTGLALEEELSSNPRREKRRRELASELGRTWGVAGSTLTLGSILERAQGDGIETDKLARSRAELRDAASRVLRRGRRIAALAKYHQGFLEELLSALTDGTAREGSPALLDTRG